MLSLGRTGFVKIRNICFSNNPITRGVKSGLLAGHDIVRPLPIHSLYGLRREIQQLLCEWMKEIYNIYSVIRHESRRSSEKLYFSNCSLLPKLPLKFLTSSLEVGMVVLEIILLTYDDVEKDAEIIIYTDEVI
ncbi:hypothetical protein NQ317_003782 [Molorchus minor]|uniref:Uncharacterized protein n=1 Tax=Molorchus minor TaxID=1323400 RepID=A0ABQ9JUZ0_9CUCU|nr:hypothetical protein NQ317_003782 [Molorchus minor]